MATQAPGSARATATAGSRQRLWRILALVGVSAFGLTFVFLASIVIFGRAEGEEFSPDSFQRREFLYFEVPLVGLQIWPISRKSTTNQLELWLVANKYVPVVAGASTTGSAGGGKGASNGSATERGPAAEGKENDPRKVGDPPKETVARNAGAREGEAQDKGSSASESERDPAAEDAGRWDLVVARRGRNITGRGDADILCRYLDAKTEGGDLFWLDWTRDHASLGKVVWPMVSRLARQQMYIFVPMVLEEARTATDAASFERRMAGTLAQRYLELAESQQRQGRHKVALSLLEDGLSFDSENSRLLQARDQSRAALRQSEASPINPNP